jgi:hypothetical protein
MNKRSIGILGLLLAASGCGIVASQSTCLNGSCVVATASPTPTATLTVTPSVGANLTVNPSTAQSVATGATTAFTLTPGGGFNVSTTVGGSCPAGSWNGTTYTTGAITASCTVSFAAVVITPIYVYETANTYVGSAVGSRSTTTATCQTDYNANWTGTVSCSHFVALLSYVADNGVQNLPSSYGVPTNAPIDNLNGTQLAATFGAFIGGNPPLGMNGATGIPDNNGPWAGFHTGGANDTNCDDWSSVAGGGGSTAVFLNGLNDNWDSGGLACTFSVRYLCLCW